MDLLDSIMNDMEQPPTIKKAVIKDEKKRAAYEKVIKERREADNKQRQLLNEFRDRFKKRLHQFINTSINEEDQTTTKLTSKPLTMIYRTIVHEICDDNADEVIAFSFGMEDIDRHCVIWKRGYEPRESELAALKAGVEYKPKCANDDLSDDETYHQTKTASKPSDKQIAEGSLRVESAQKVLPGKQYGFVPVSLKEDKRSVEQVIDDQRKLKKQRMLDEGSSASSTSKSNLTQDDTSKPSKYNKARSSTADVADE